MLLGLQQYAQFTQENLQTVAQYFKLESYEKDTIILDIGHVNNKLYFVEEGVCFTRVFLPRRWSAY